MTFNNTGTKNLYAVLGILPSADKKTIKEAFRKLAKKYHPDINKGDKFSEAKFKEIAYAYEILSDEKKRCEYDAVNGFTIKRRVNYTNPYQTKEHYKNQTYTNSYTKNSDNEKKSSNESQSFSGGFADFVSGVFFSSEDNAPINGSDITVDLTISFDEAIKGTKRKVNVLHSEPCPFCQGKRFLNEVKCSKCGGSGEIHSQKSIVVRIPQYTKQGDVIIVKNEGNKGKFGGKNGNLALKINVEKNEIFRFDNLDVLSDVYITPSEAALGTNISIPTIDGYVNMKIPPETSSSQKFKLHGIGIFDKEKDIRGNHIVTIFIKMPKNLTNQEKKLYEKLGQLRKEEKHG